LRSFRQEFFVGVRIVGVCKQIAQALKAFTLYHQVTPRAAEDHDRALAPHRQKPAPERPAPAPVLAGAAGNFGQE